MKILLEKAVGDAITTCTDEAEGTTSAALSCEAENLAPKRAKEIVLAAIAAWDQDALIMFRSVGAGRKESVRVFLIDMAELAVVVDEALESEEVISIRDPSVTGGCTFDFSPDEVQGEEATVELLVTAWGVHEAMVQRLAASLGKETFRQGTSLRLER